MRKDGYLIKKERFLLNEKEICSLFFIWTVKLAYDKR